MARSNAKLKSIQGNGTRKGGKPNSTRDLQARSLRAATNHGLPWSTDEVARIVAGVQKDETSFEMALAVGRSYYSTMSARAHVAFAMRHASALDSAIRSAAVDNARKSRRKA